MDTDGAQIFFLALGEAPLGGRGIKPKPEIPIQPDLVAGVAVGGGATPGLAGVADHQPAVLAAFYFRCQVFDELSQIRMGEVMAPGFADQLKLALVREQGHGTASTAGRVTADD